MRRRSSPAATAARSRRDWRSMRALNSSFAAMTISAAADGVGARTSATKSAMVKSTSWPTAVTTGTGQPAMARATGSWLNGHEVLGRSAAASDDDDVHAGHAADGADGVGDLGGGALALHPRRPDDEVGVGMAAGEDLDDVAQAPRRRATSRCRSWPAAPAAAACATRRRGPRPGASSSAARTPAAARRSPWGWRWSQRI